MSRMVLLFLVSLAMIGCPGQCGGFDVVDPILVRSGTFGPGSIAEGPDAEAFPQGTGVLFSISVSRASGLVRVTYQRGAHEVVETWRVTASEIGHFFP